MRNINDMSPSKKPKIAIAKRTFVGLDVDTEDDDAEANNVDPPPAYVAELEGRTGGIGESITVLFFLFR